MPHITISICSRKGVTKRRRGSWGGCAAGASTMRARKAGAAAGTSVLAIVGAALVPKCPLCVAAALTALGLGGAIAQRVAPFVRTAGFVIGGVAFALLVFSFVWAPRRRRASAGA